MSKKKEKYVPLVGITGVGEDYNVYKLTVVERITGFAIGLAAGFLAAHIMFGTGTRSVFLLLSFWHLI